MKPLATSLWGLSFIWAPLLCALAVMTFACSSSQSAKVYGKDTFIITGEMHFVDVESGCWQFITADSVHYELTGKDTKTLLKEGRQATVAVRELRNVSSLCMAGKIVELLDVIKIYNN